jgi:catechol 2,3-dioxygenase-like lactoylglutathione lyase family enzyme
MLASNDLVAFAAVTDLGRAREFYSGRLGLPVLHLDDFACVLDAHGTMLRVTFTRYEGMGQDDDGVWTAPSGDRLAWFTDPDGNTLSLTQFG